MMGGKSAVNVLIQQDVAAGKPLTEPRQRLAGGAVTGIPGDLQRRAPTRLIITEQPGHVIAEDGFFRNLALSNCKVATPSAFPKPPDVVGKKGFPVED